MAAYGYTYTLPTMTGTISKMAVELRNADFPAAAIGTGPNAIDNNGGNLRAYVDDTKAIQLPLEVVSFVTGASPIIHVEVDVTNAQTGSTIYLEADEVETNQPAESSTYGSEAVWSQDAAILHLSNDGDGTLDEFKDSTGNGHHGQLTTGTSISAVTTEHARGGLWLDFVSNIISLKNSHDLVNNTAFTLSIMTSIDVSSSADGMFGNRWNGSNDWAQIQSSRRGFSQSSTSAENLADGGARPLNTHTHVAYIVSTSAVELYDNGVKVAEENILSLPETINNTNTGRLFRVGTYFDGRAAFRLDGRAGFARVRQTIMTPDHIKAEYENRTAAGAWGTVGAWEEQGGGGPSDQTMTLTEISNTNVIPQPTVLSEQSISLSLIPSSAVITAPSLGNSQSIDLVPITSGIVIPAATVLTEQQITLASIASTSNVAIPTLQEAIAVQLTIIDSTINIPTLTVVQPQIIDLEGFGPTSIVGFVTIQGGEETGGRSRTGFLLTNRGILLELL